MRLRGWINILDWFIIRQYLTTYLFIQGAVLAICFVIDWVEKVDEFMDKNPPIPNSEIAFEYYLNFFPYYGNLLTPICIFLTVIFFTSRMAQRTELVSMLGAGVSFYRIMRPYLIASGIVALATFALKGYVVPKTTEIRLNFEYKYLNRKHLSKNRNVHKKIGENSYFYLSFYREDKRTGRKEGRTVSIENWANGDIIERLEADKMRWIDSTQSWRMEKVRVRRFEGKEKELLEFIPELDTVLLLTPNDIYVREQEAETRTNGELEEFIVLEEMRGSDILADLYHERHRRYADPIAVIVLTLIGFAMASRKSRGGIALQIGLGLILSFIYIALIFLGKALTGDAMEAWIGVWLPTFSFFMISLVLLYLAPK